MQRRRPTILRRKPPFAQHRRQPTLLHSAQLADSLIATTGVLLAEDNTWHGADLDGALQALSDSCRCCANHETNTPVPQRV